MCQCFNNFLQASWPLALILLHRTKSCPPKLVSGLYCVRLFHGKVCLGGHLGRHITDKSKIQTISRECHHSLAFTSKCTASKMTKNVEIQFIMRHHITESCCDSISFNLSSQSHSLNSVCVCQYVCVSVCIWCARVNWPIRSSISDCVERRM